MEAVIHKPLNSIWLKASVIGSIWASIEIILGSFLHNLKLPLSGMILSLISVWLLISFIQIWKEKGLVWRAGIICALMKSISPSAFILGPMIGIFTEALIIELFIFVFGKNLIGYLTGGAFAVLSTIIQKLISLLILYGFDFIKILADLYKYAVKQIDLEQLSPVYLLTVITAVYIFTGMAGSLGGYLTGLKYVKTKDFDERQSEIVLQSKNQLFSQTTSQNYSVFFLMINLFSIIAVLFLINSDLILTTILISFIYVGFCIYNYKNSLKRLKKLSFWISFLIITFAAAFLWNGFSGGAFFSMNGLIIGLKMNARAIIMVIGFASISVELRNPVIKSLLYHRGFAKLYQASGLAFSALPFLISNRSKPENIKSFPGTYFRGLFSQAETLLRIFEKEHLKKPQVVIITGEIHEGKTSYVKKIIDNLQNQDFKIGGFLSLGLQEGGDRIGFNLYDIETTQQVELCRKTHNDNWLKCGHYYFDPDGLSKGNEILSIDRLSGKHAVVIDEIGHLELGDQGWSDAIEKICRNSLIPQIWIVRKNLVPMVLKKWNVGNIYIFKISEDDISDVQKLLIGIISSKQGDN